MHRRTPEHAHTTYRMQDQDHIHTIDFHIFNHMITIIVYIMYRVVVQGPRVTEAVMKMFSHDDISAIQSKKFVPCTPYSGH